MSIEILREKNPKRENRRKIIIHMLHDTLPTCEKINWLIQIEKNSNRNNNYYTNKYDKHTNESCTLIIFKKLRQYTTYFLSVNI